MGGTIFGKSLREKIAFGIGLMVITSNCYAISFGPVISALQAGFSQALDQATRTANESIAKLTGLERLNIENLAQTSKIATISQMLGDTLGIPMQLPNTDQIKTSILRWMQDYITDPNYTLSYTNALEIPYQGVSFGDVTPTKNVIDHTATHRQIENQLIAHNDTPTEERRLAQLREYLIEDATVSGISLATVNKQTLNKTRNKIKEVSEQAIDSKNLREDMRANNAYLMLVAVELTNLREIQTQQLELMAAFARTFVSPMSHMEAKQKFRQNSKGRR